MWVCLQRCAYLFVCIKIHEAPVLNKRPGRLCGSVPGATDAWIMCCTTLRATSAQSSRDRLWMWPWICIEWRNGSSLWCSNGRVRGTGEGRTGPTPCRQNQVLSVWRRTLPSISPVHSALPRIKLAQSNTSAPTTGRQDKQSSMPACICCYIYLMCRWSPDDGFFNNWF